MKIAITGAGGFIGKAVVREARRKAHDVVAIVRQNVPDTWAEDSGISVAACDLLTGEGLENALQDVDVIIHLAAVMQGQHQYAQTMLGTHNLLAAMDQTWVKKLIGLSSISVLDYVNTAAMSTIDETTPLNNNDTQLGPYAQMKRDQERTLLAWQSRSSALDSHKMLTLLRPGLVYSDDQLSDAHVGFKMFAVSHAGEVPVVHVDSVAQAAIAACTAENANTIIHLINDNPPSQAAYIEALH